METVQRRMLELVGILLQRPLTIYEREDLRFCHRYLVERTWKIGLLEMYSFMASLANDVDEQHRICCELDKLS